MGLFRREGILAHAVVGKAGFGNASSLRARIAEEPCDERVFVLAKFKDAGWLLDTMRQLYGENGQHKSSAGENHVRRAVRKTGATHSLWAATPTLLDDEVKVIEPDLIELLNLTGGVQRPTPRGSLQAETVEALRALKAVIHASCPGGSTNMRQVVVDIEATGLDVMAGHRIIEIGCVELCGGELTGRQLHGWFNPEGEISGESELVHGLSRQFLAAMPRFATVIDELQSILQGAELVALNAPFVREFLDAELIRAGRRSTKQLCNRVVDLRALARRILPGDPGRLEALCTALGVNQPALPLPSALCRATRLADICRALPETGKSAVSADR